MIGAPITQGKCLTFSYHGNLLWDLNQRVRSIGIIFFFLRCICSNYILESVWQSGVHQLYKHFEGGWKWNMVAVLFELRLLRESREIHLNININIIKVQQTELREVWCPYPNWIEISSGLLTNNELDVQGCWLFPPNNWEPKLTQQEKTY